ncbi:MAG TPA: PAS domain S-box protein, partial [Solirubrobacterales bacterium]|nr:PAS domain S-box protein [Solirubrobacterales bacterium]
NVVERRTLIYARNRMEDHTSEALEREFLEFAPDAVIGVDESGEIKVANSRTHAVFGYSRDALIGESVEILVPELVRSVHVAHRDRYFEGPRPRPMGAGLDLYARRKDGTEFPCEISLSVVATGDGMMALAAIRDITDRKRDRDELRRAVRRLQAATDVAIAVGGETDLGRVLEAIVERGRALVEARALIILLREGEDLVVAATAAVAGGLDPAVAELRIPARHSSDEVLLGRIKAVDVGRDEIGRALIAPLLFRGDPLGVVVALDRVGPPGRFDDEDQRLLEAFAASAATGVATARSMAEERLQNTIDSAEQERTRWARELHDETLQALAVLRMRIASALREESPESLHETGQEAVEQIDEEILKLRRLITELRPASLDTIGLEAALQTLGQQHRQASGIEVDYHLDLPREEELRPTPILETAVYRLVQEALNNVTKHSMGRRAVLVVRARRVTIEIEVIDDGVGFEPSLVREGFGLVGMRERAALLGGTLEVDSTKGAGTRLRAEIPLTTRGEEGTETKPPPVPDYRARRNIR